MQLPLRTGTWFICIGPNSEGDCKFRPSNFSAVCSLIAPLNFVKSNMRHICVTNDKKDPPRRIEPAMLSIEPSYVIWNGKKMRSMMICLRFQQTKDQTYLDFIQAKTSQASKVRRGCKKMTKIWSLYCGFVTAANFFKKVVNLKKNSQTLRTVQCSVVAYFAFCPF